MIGFWAGVWDHGVKGEALDARDVRVVLRVPGVEHLLTPGEAVILAAELTRAANAATERMEGRRG